MIIDKVEFSRLVSFGAYNNIRVGVRVDLGGSESPHEALRRAQSWVHRELVRMVGEDALNMQSANQQELSLDEEQF